SRERAPQRRFICTSDLSPPWNLKIPQTQHNNRPDCYSGRFRRPWKRLKVYPTLKRMDKQLLLADLMTFINKQQS
ncbi:unnamed protein product, partial [Hymenolepis diminuta]